MIDNYKTGPILHVVGARPNFIKLAPLYRVLKGTCDQKVIHTGQHYDRSMSESFFQVLNLPEPDYNLAVGSASHAQQTAQVMLGLEPLFEKLRPSAVIVYGDVNSTAAASLVAAKLLIPLVHVESGLRSRDRTMPEELNRLVTDQLSDVLLTPSVEASANLLSEGIEEHKIFLVGNIMIDTLSQILPRASEIQLGELPDKFALLTLHRPSNVDDPAGLSRLMHHLHILADVIPIIFPVHPRTGRQLEKLDLIPQSDRLQLVPPMDYLQFIAMQSRATVVITDSGGIQEETTYLGKPCLTMRNNTERPVTVSEGSNILIGDDPSTILPWVEKILEGRFKKGHIPEYWDGHTADRIKAVLQKLRLC
jgi:UDP-N-acetylglucosamine 2-epimerase (non-hydrolysing)